MRLIFKTNKQLHENNSKKKHLNSHQPKKDKNQNFILEIKFCSKLKQNFHTFSQTLPSSFVKRGISILPTKKSIIIINQFRLFTTLSKPSQKRLSKKRKKPSYTNNSDRFSFVFEEYLSQVDYLSF